MQKKMEKEQRMKNKMLKSAPTGRCFPLACGDFTDSGIVEIISQVDKPDNQVVPSGICDVLVVLVFRTARCLVQIPEKG
jgi:hypothetical protein